MSGTGWRLRPGRASDAATLIGIEQRACGLLRGHPAWSLFSRTHLAAADHIDAAGKGRLWVAEAEGQVPGYALYGELDGAVHLEQMDVEPADGRRGLGAPCSSASRHAPRRRDSGG